MKVSFDYDDTLDRASVQRYAKILIEQGHDVWIVTSRYKDESLYEDYLGADYNPTTDNHNELFRVAEELGISKSKIKFTNMTDKVWYFKRHPEFLWHLDDNNRDINQLNSKTKVRGVHFGTNWRGKCEKIIKKHETTQNA